MEVFGNDAKSRSWRLGPGLTLFSKDISGINAVGVGYEMIRCYCSVYVLTLMS